MSDQMTLAGQLDRIWDLLHRAVAEDRSPLRCVTLATTDSAGTPQARMVVLRQIDRGNSAVTFYTDFRSHKVAQIAQNASAALLLWSPETVTQLRLSGTAVILDGSERDWAQVPDHMREAYGHVPEPGTPITAADSWSVDPQLANFAKCQVTLEAIDVVTLDPAGHSRALYERARAPRRRWARRSTRSPTPRRSRPPNC
ncbi:MAG: pyridoxamine 5'-phosphate oxidase family protein [Pseudomonadota bacterium]